MWRNRRKKLDTNAGVSDLEAAPETTKEGSTIAPMESPLGAREVDSSVHDSQSNFPLVISHASKSFGGHEAIKNISLSVQSREIFALLGPNGAGKTTLINCVLGLYRLSSGNAKIRGFDILGEQDQVYKHIGICPQSEILWPDLTCREHLLFYSRIKGIDQKNEKAAVMRCLEQVELLAEQTKPAKELSGGQRRRLCLAIALVGSPPVVFLDEPTTGNFFGSPADLVGLDPHIRRDVIRNAIAYC